MSEISFLFYLFGDWVLRIGMIPIVAHRRRLTSALSWLAVIFFFPWVGVVLYVLLAEHPAGRGRRRHRRVLEQSRTVQRLAFQAPHRVEARLPGEGVALSRLTDRLGGFALLDGNGVELLSDHRAAVDRMVCDVDAARAHVHVLFYIIDDDEAGRRMADALERAAARGVRCRVLADAVGSAAFHRSMAPGLRERGVEVRKVLPLGRLLRRLRPLDLRNHRKLVVVDGRVAYTGSMNLSSGRVRYGDEPLPWRDVMVRLGGPSVLQLQLVFLEDWAYNTDHTLDEPGLLPAPSTEGAVPVQVVPSGPVDGAETLNHLLAGAVAGARERVILTTPYLIPDEATRVALRLAALRDVEVHLVVPSVSDSRVVTWASESYYSELLGDGVRIWVHGDGFLHAKTVSVDGVLALLGSANLDRRSFYLNFELNLLLYGREVVGRVVAMQEGYLAHSRAVDRARWEARPDPRKLREDVARLLSPLL